MALTRKALIAASSPTVAALPGGDVTVNQPTRRDATTAPESDAATLHAEADLGRDADQQWYEEDDIAMQDRRPRTPLRTAAEWAMLILAAFGVAMAVRTFLLAHFRVSGSSMLTTVHTNDRVFVNKLSYLVGDPHRGEVIVLHQHRSEDDLIKRVIALPGETVAIDDCQVYIDNKRLDEPYLSEDVRRDQSWCSFPPTVVDEGKYFVLGDNRGFSADSRVFGPVPEADIVGRAFVVFWPLGDARWL